MRATSVSLSRDLGLFSATMIGIGGMIGAGIFALTGIAAGLAGSSLVLVFLFNGLLTLPTAMAYAELGSTIPRAGGGYVWVNEGVGGVHGFLCGWMSWFAYIAAGSLYALAFGRFATETWLSLGLPAFGLSTQILGQCWMAAIVLAFTLVNALGASETARVGNVVTVAKLAILVLFVLLGLAFMAGNGAALAPLHQDFLPNGMAGLLLAMGLTYIAFEGFEIIAQSGEEVKAPRSNIPRAIFLSMGITVTLYMLVAWVALGAVAPPPGQAAHTYLGEARELAIVEVARQIFPLGTGGFLLLLSGLAATASALNAAAYSASRVAFAMGRSQHLPALFARIHPTRGAPTTAVIASGALMFLLAFSLPIEAAATAGSIMFLLIFIQVNYTVIALRHTASELARGFRMPAVPYLPLAAIIANALLAIFMYVLHPIAWGMALLWALTGVFAYFLYFAPRAAQGQPKEVIFEEIEAMRGYSVLVPVADRRTAGQLGTLAALFAKAEKGEMAALNVIAVPRPLALGHGRAMLEQRQALLEKLGEAAAPHKVPVHSLIRLGRDVAEATRKTAAEIDAKLLILGWPGHTKSRGRMLGSIIDPLLASPPCDLAIVHPHKMESLGRILVAVNQSDNSRLAVRLARQLASVTGAELSLVHVVASQAELDTRGEQFWEPLLIDVAGAQASTRMLVGKSVVGAVLQEAKGYDLIILGAASMPWWKRMMVGDVPKRIARKAACCSMIVRVRAPGTAHFFRRLLHVPS